jgi:hypothetical protein
MEVGTYSIVLSVIDMGLNTDFDDMTIFVLDTEAPVADAGRDFAVGQGTEVTLYGRWSSDNVGVDTWTWIFFEDDEAVILVGETVTRSFDLAGEFVITLNVTDAAGNWDFDELVLTVLDTERPKAVAGEDMEVDQWETVRFDASDSSDNVGIVDYIWTLAEGTSISRMLGPEPEYVFGTSGRYGIELEVWDAAGNVNFDSITVRVNPVPMNRLWRLGPIGDQDGPLGGVRVEVVMNGTTHVEFTHDDGFAEFTVAIADLVSPVSVVATKEGWEDLEFQVVLDEDGDATGTIPVMKKESGGDGDDDDDDDDDDETDWLAWSLVIILCIAFGGTLLYLSAAAKKAGLDE